MSTVQEARTLDILANLSTDEEWRTDPFILCKWKIRRAGLGLAEARGKMWREHPAAKMALGHVKAELTGAQMFKVFGRQNGAEVAPAEKPSADNVMKRFGLTEEQCHEIAKATKDYEEDPKELAKIIAEQAVADIRDPEGGHLTKGGQPLPEYHPKMARKFFEATNPVSPALLKHVFGEGAPAMLLGPALMRWAAEQADELEAGMEAIAGAVEANLEFGSPGN